MQKVGKELIVNGMENGSQSDRRLSLKDVHGFVRSFQNNALALFDDDCYEHWSVTRRFSSFSLNLFNHPDAVQEILVQKPQEFPKSSLVNTLLGTALGRGLVTSEGEYWRRNRSIVQPAFDHRNLSAYASLIGEQAIKLTDVWDKGEASTIDAQREMMKLTLKVICGAMFSTDASSLVDLVDSSSRHYQKQMTFSPWGVIPGVRAVWANHVAQKGKKIIHELDEAIYALIRERRSGQPKTDLLNDMINAKNVGAEAQLSTQEVRDQVITIFMAGHETSALSLAWCFQLLAHHPLVQQAVVDELEEQLGDAPITLDVLSRLPYMRAVIDETLRLYPAIHTLGWREAQWDTNVGGVRLKKGAIVLVSPWVLHHHKMLWQDPDKFLPERFLNTASKGKERFTYIPFSMGPRVCVAKNFALTEMMIILGELIRRFKFRNTTTMVEPKAMITLLPSSSITLHFARRGREGSTMQGKAFETHTV